MIRLADVADLPVLALGTEPDATGRPGRPVLVIDTDAWPEHRRPDRSRRPAAAGERHRGDRHQRPGAGPLAGAADISFARSADGLDGGGQAKDSLSVYVDDPQEALARLDERVRAAPMAALALTWLLRGSAGLPVPDALAQESAAYSMLLASAEFRTWLARRPAARPADPGQRVRVTRESDVLSVCLTRPQRRNAVDAAMRDALTAALTVADSDPALSVVLSGAGPCFSAGGDLDEFGSYGDPAQAHHVRMAASAGAILHRLRDRATVRLHGSCVGAGIEIPAFAGTVIAAPDTRLALPEVGMGLIPGAGGTVSIPRRIGRQRALWLALSGAQLDAATALEWGLVDAIG